MSVELEGGCRVSDMREGASETIDNLTIWTQVSRATGAHAISLRVLQFMLGASPAIRNPHSDDVLFMVEQWDNVPCASKCTIEVDGRSTQIEANTGIYVGPGQTLRVNNSSDHPVVLISSRCPEPDSDDEVTTQPMASTVTGDKTPAVVRLDDRRSTPTADRWYRVLVDGEVGSTQVTQFVGSIPPGRAPDHFHNYEEVLFILRGKGRMWAGKTNTEIGPGSCVYLPKGQLHCVENTGEGELRLLGVFYPAGSPAVRYEADTQ